MARQLQLGIFLLLVVGKMIKIQSLTAVVNQSGEPERSSVKRQKVEQCYSKL